MARTKRKTTKTRKHKQKKKRHLNAGAFFMIIICLLLVGIIYYFYTYEQEKRKQKPRETVQESVPPPKTTPQTTVRETAPQTATSRIIDYTDLEYPVSYSSRPEQLIFHTGHTVSYNKDWKIPNWVSYELTIDETMGEEKRHDKFVPDPQVKEGMVTTADYRNSGYDRGHMVPAADMKWSNASMTESFYLSNICPQHPKLNQHRWKELEDKVRKWAIADSAIIVICGPIINDSPKCIGSNKVAVPDGFFKVVLSPYAKSPRAIGFIFDNEHCRNPLKSHAVSIDSVESITGLDFFAPLPDDIEEALEAYVDTLYWGL